MSNCPKCHDGGGLMVINGQNECCDVCKGSGEDPHAEIAEKDKKIEELEHNVQCLTNNFSLECDLHAKERQAHEETKKELTNYKTLYVHASDEVGNHFRFYANEKDKNTRLREALEKVQWSEAWRERKYEDGVFVPTCLACYKSKYSKTPHKSNCFINKALKEEK